MLRDKSLIPLSHQHQRALALCVRIGRASPIPDRDLPAWQSELEQLFQSEIATHFAAEENVLFPPAELFTDLTPVIEDLRADHRWLREQFSRATSKSLTAGEMNTLANRLSGHIRKEERQLFEGMQAQMSREQLNALGKKLEDALKDSTHACALRPKQDLE